MSKKNKKVKSKKDPRAADPAVDPLVAADLQAKQDSCEHVDDDEDGVCDLCGIEVEVEVEGDNEPNAMAQTDKRFTNSNTGGSLDPPPMARPEVLGSTAVPAGSRDRMVTAEKLYFSGRTYNKGDKVPMTDAEARLNRKHVQ